MLRTLKGMARSRVYERDGEQYVGIPPAFDLPDGEVDIRRSGGRLVITPILAGEEQTTSNEALARACADAGTEPQMDEDWTA